MNSSPPNRQPPKWFIPSVISLALILFFLLKWRSHHIVIATIDYVVENLSARSGVSPFLVRGIVILATIPFFWAVAKYTNVRRPSLKLYRNPYGIIIVAYVGLFFLAMYFASLDAYSYKWCADTPEGIRTFDAAGTDPIYGIALKPCSFDQIVTIRRGQRGFTGPQSLSIPDARHFAFFDPITAKPRVWYYQSSEGAYAFYDKPGKFPGTGESLLPIDGATIQKVIHLQEAVEADKRKLALQKASEPYVDFSVVQGDGKQIAVLLFPKAEQDVPSSVSQTVASALSEQGFAATFTFFKPAFVAEGRAQKLFSGDWSGIDDLGMGGRPKYLVLGKSDTSFVSSSQFEGLITSNVALTLKCLNTAGHQNCGSQSITATGAGYSRDASLQNALDKALPQIAIFVKKLPH
jgi:hypothetical protein